MFFEKVWKNLTDFKPLPSARWFNTALPGCFLNSKLGTSSSFFKDRNTKILRKRYHLLDKKNQANLFSNSGVEKQISQNNTKQAYTIPNRTELLGSFTHSTASKITRIRMLYYVWNKKHFDLQQIFLIYKLGKRNGCGHNLVLITRSFLVPTRSFFRYFEIMILSLWEKIALLRDHSVINDNCKGANHGIINNVLLWLEV